MGTKIHCKSYLPGFYSMRDLNDDSSSSCWPLFYGDKQIPNGQYYNGFMQRSLVDGYPGHDKDSLKQKMLEHEAVFKNQVCELHRLYKIQRDMMEEVRRKEMNKNRASMEPASSSSFHGSQLPLEEAKKWHMAGFPLLNSSYGRTSISGAEIVNSPMSCVKTNNTQPNHFLFQNGSTSKDSEGPRPLKVRKKLFDLQLPADEYIDVQEGESSKGCKESDNSMKLFLGVHGLKGSNGLADLNEPIQIEEATAPSSVDFLGRTENMGIKGVDRCAKPNAGYLGVTGETIHMRDGFSITSSMENKVNTRGRLSNICDAASTRSNLSFTTQGPVQGMLNQVDPPATYRNGYNREDVWRDGLRHGREPFDRNPNQTSNNYHLEPIASRVTGSYPFVTSSSFATSWAQSVSSWATPTSSFAQNVTALDAPSKPLLFQRSESTSNWKTSSGFDYLKCCKGDNVTSDRSTNHGFGISKPAIDINLNEVLSNEIVIPQDLNGQNKSKDHLSALPWLKPKAVADSKVLLASKDEIAENLTVKKILGIPIFERHIPENESLPLASTSVSVYTRSEEKNITSERKNGLIDINVACEPDEQIVGEEKPTLENETLKKGTAIRDHIDLNSCVSDCEDPPPPCYERKTASVKITLEIDLEVPVFLESEDDDSILSKENTIQNRDEQIKDDALRNAAETIFAISSSSPQVDPSCPQIDPSEASLAEALLLFVDVVSNKPRPSKNRSCLEIIDDFEAMTLQLAETKEEDYMPKPFVLETPKMEEENGGIPTRPRRGQARRGRQRRDFQRDILPGLTTLSRHEVTEDLQTFGGLMRATGHSWSSGLARRNGTRNGGGRGRRRTAVVENVVPSAICTTTPLAKQLNNNNHHHVEGGLEDRSLTGWGKTTRRPRRQRCPAGNISTIVIT